MEKSHIILEDFMDDLKKFDLTESNITEPIEEDLTMEPVKKSKIIPIIVIVGIVLGIGTGFYLAQKKLLLANGDGISLTGSGPQTLTSDTSIKKGDIFGSADEQTFRDQTEGILVSGGIDGEGSHHIERGENKSQWVYITSTVVDLDLLVGDRVMVWGETNQGKKAGWLMDVGRVKVLELNAALLDDTTGSQD